MCHGQGRDLQGACNIFLYAAEGGWTIFSSRPSLCHANTNACTNVLNSGFPLKTFASPCCQLYTLFWVAAPANYYSSQPGSTGTHLCHSFDCPVSESLEPTMGSSTDPRPQSDVSAVIDQGDLVQSTKVTTGSFCKPATILLTTNSLEHERPTIGTEPLATAQIHGESPIHRSWKASQGLAMGF